MKPYQMIAQKWNTMSPMQREQFLFKITDEGDLDNVDYYSTLKWEELPQEVTDSLLGNTDLNENKMNKSTLKALIKECYLEVLKEQEENDLPVDTGKNINMGFDNNVGLTVDKGKQSKISKLQAAIDGLSKKIKSNLELYKAGKMSIEDYKKAIGNAPADLKMLAAKLEAELAKAAKI